MGPKRRIGHGGSPEVGFPSDVPVSWSSCVKRQVSAWLCGLRHMIPSRCPAMVLRPTHFQRACTDTLGAGRRRSDKAPDLAVDQDTTPWGSLPRLRPMRHGGTCCSVECLERLVARAPVSASSSPSAARAPAARAGGFASVRVFSAVNARTPRDFWRSGSWTFPGSATLWS